MTSSANTLTLVPMTDAPDRMDALTASPTLAMAPAPPDGGVRQRAVGSALRCTVVIEERKLHPHRRSAQRLVSTQAQRHRHAMGTKLPGTLRPQSGTNISRVSRRSAWRGRRPPQTPLAPACLSGEVCTPPRRCRARLCPIDGMPHAPASLIVPERSSCVAALGLI